MRSDLPSIWHRVCTWHNPVPVSGTSSPITASTTVQPTAPTVAAWMLTVNDLKKHIKRNQTLFSTLKDEKYQDSWYWSFVNQYRAQDLEEIINPNYRPQTLEEQKIFEWKEKWTYAVLESKNCWVPWRKFQHFGGLGPVEKSCTTYWTPNPTSCDGNAGQWWTWNLKGNNPGSYFSASSRNNTTPVQKKQCLGF